MRQQRVYTSQPLTPGESVQLEADSSHHLSKVLRLQTGDAIILFNGDGHEYTASIEICARQSVQVLVQKQLNVSRESPLQITLAQGISRGSRMDYTLQKAVELGINTIIPLWTTRTQVKLDAKRMHKRVKHWQGVIQSASEQSGRLQLPELLPALSLQEWVTNTSDNHEMKLLLHPEAGSSLNTLHKPEGKIALLIGPEGGITEEEIQLCKDHCFTDIRLGPRILRTETAALATLSAIQALWGRF